MSAKPLAHESVEFTDSSGSDSDSGEDNSKNQPVESQKEVIAAPAVPAVRKLYAPTKGDADRRKITSKLNLEKARAKKKEMTAMRKLEAATALIEEQRIAVETRAQKEAVKPKEKKSKKKVVVESESDEEDSSTSESDDEEVRPPTPKKVSKAKGAPKIPKVKAPKEPKPPKLSAKELKKQQKMLEEAMWKVKVEQQLVEAKTIAKQSKRVKKSQKKVQSESDDDEEESAPPVPVEKKYKSDAARQLALMMGL